jgi:hypothetical protein
MLRPLRNRDPGAYAEPKRYSLASVKAMKDGQLNMYQIQLKSGERHAFSILKHNNNFHFYEQNGQPDLIQHVMTHVAHGTKLPVHYSQEARIDECELPHSCIKYGTHLQNMWKLNKAEFIKKHMGGFTSYKK